MRAARITAAGLLVIVGLALIDDALDGFAWTRHAPTWQRWLGGLFVGGLVSLVLEFVVEWTFESDHWYTSGHRRSTRMLMAVAGAAALAGIVWLIALK